MAKRNNNKQLSAQDNRHNVLSLRDALNRLFDESVWDPFEVVAPNLLTGSRMGFPRVDMSEDDKTITVSADIPGLDPDQVEIEVEDDHLILSGVMDKEDKQEDKNKRYYRYEREYGEFRRVLPLPARVDQGQVQAKAKNGVLTITLPKLADTSSSRKKIKIKSE